MKRKLQAYQVIEIRQSDLPTSYLARQYNVNRKTIENIKQGLTWKRLKSFQPSGYENENYAN